MTLVQPDRTAVSAPVVILPPPIVRVESFLNAGQLAALIMHCHAVRPEFVPSLVTTKEADYRSSQVSYNLDGVRDDFEAMVRTCLPLMRQFLGAPEAEPTGMECQLTVSHHGDFFKVHTDNSGEKTKPRFISYVYYFTSEAAAFTGGDLVLYDSPIKPTGDDPKPRHVVPFVRNSIVFFRSSTWHEVTTVDNPSADFADGRFTVNGWVRW